MAGIFSLRSWIDLVEGKNKNKGGNAPAAWGVSRSALFDETLREALRTFPDLREKLGKFTDLKLSDPLNARYGKHDRPCTGELVGFWHAHLRDDAILIYNLANRSINLVAVVTHAEIEGKRLKQTAKRIQQFR
jgi:mRNA-degrading endonuclease YafQ of YafQ-DinJ toxin-antitoxin module